MCINLSSAYDVRAENAGHVNLCLCLSFQTRISVMKNGVMRMMSVMGTYSVFCSKTSSRLKRGARFEVGGGGGGGGGGRPSLIWLVRVRYVLLNTRS